MNTTAENLIQAWKKRNITGWYCQDKAEALQKFLALIPLRATIGISGSQTLQQLGLLQALEVRGNPVLNQYKPGISKEQSSLARREGVGADYYVASANAVARSGELVFLSAYGNRVAGVSNAKNVIVVCGINKIADTLEAAMVRAREYAAPLNCKRLDWNTPCAKDGVCKQSVCLFQEYKRMCAQMLIIEAEVTPHRFQVVLVGENLGF